MCKESTESSDVLLPCPKVAPNAFTLVGSALSEIRLMFRPVASGKMDIAVHIVDSESRELVSIA